LSRALELALPIVAVCAVASCGGAAVTRHDAAAERAYSAGRYLEAAERFAEAADQDPKARDREEARYRQAMALERAGHLGVARAVLERLLRSFPRGERAPRASYDIALVDIEEGRTDQGYSELDALVRKYPDSGSASAALERYLARLANDGEPHVREYLERLAPAVGKTALAEYVDYEHARSRERQGDLDGARSEYLGVADRYPYPRGVFWDDSLFRAGNLSVALGAPRDGIAVFERLLEAREPSFLQGSYERGRYAEAAYRIAELYRDVLHEPVRARAAFERIFATYPTSRLRDDAAWNAARLAVGAGDADGACRLLRSLVADSPESRYVACARAVCPAIVLSASAGPCHEYLLRTPP
jgi:TolA-binding protein